MNDEVNKNIGDKYSGLITILAVVFMVIYADGIYDKWDNYLSVLGLILSYYYFQNMHINNWFYHILTFSLASVSFTALFFSFCGVVVKNDCKEETQLNIGSYQLDEFYVFIATVIFLYAIYKIRNPVIQAQ